jgi:hypothetical protein
MATNESLELGQPRELVHPDGRVEHPEVHFEPSDLSLRGVLVVIVVSALLIALLQFGTWILFHHEKSLQEEMKRPLSPLAVISSQQLPVEPRLEQLDRLSDVTSHSGYAMEKSKDDILHSYGETDEEGFVHVPIKWAIDQAAAELKGTATESAPGKSRGLVGHGESNSGRMLQGR